MELLRFYLSLIVTRRPTRATPVKLYNAKQSQIFTGVARFDVGPTWVDSFIYESLLLFRAALLQHRSVIYESRILARARVPV